MKLKTVLSLLLAMVLLMGCALPQPISKSDFVLDTIASISIYKGGDEELLNEAFKLCREYERLFSAEISSSDIGRLNRAGGESIDVSEETYGLLETACQYGELTGGLFDVTIYPVSLLWDFRSPDAVPPSVKDIEAALSHVDYHNIILNEDGTVRLADPEAEVGLGGIAKGYIADRIGELLRECGVRSAIINLGGNVLTIGENKDGEAFRIGIQAPFKDMGEVLDVMPSADSSVVSSGCYERYFEYEGRLYHHILDPSTGFPAESGLNGVTVKTERSVDADALSTSLFLLGYGKGSALLDRLKEERGMESSAVFVDRDNKLHYYNIGKKE